MTTQYARRPQKQRRLPAVVFLPRHDDDGVAGAAFDSEAAFADGGA